MSNLAVETDRIIDQYKFDTTDFTQEQLNVLTEKISRHETKFQNNIKRTFLLSKEIPDYWKCSDDYNDNTCSLYSKNSIILATIHLAQRGYGNIFSKLAPELFNNNNIPEVVGVETIVDYYSQTIQSAVFWVRAELDEYGCSLSQELVKQGINIALVG